MPDTRQMRELLRIFGNAETDKFLRKIDEIQKLKNKTTEDFFVDATANFLKSKGYRIIRARRR